ncbi:SixA phosphatase family protein [Flavobacterium succinicans]|uniref:Histidine phosphatase superfamily n=1 Tax=Flavobacterium succinicans TaxID=29536 RepID=A0A199XPF7_9FLAO|nr:phosphoglycerate mutase family protein [Flavobacterium succinicans]OAZ03623.1 histidine phosphatase superfamily [Flavobacterium succinicans]
MKKIVYAFVFLVFTLGALGQTTSIYLIRHAEKVDNSKNPDLSKAGLERAEHWKTILSQVPLKAVYSTDFLRTVQTASPTATSKNLEIIKYDPKTIDLEQLKKDYKGQAVLIVGHSNTTPDLVNKIINKKVYAPIDDTVFGNLYIITISGNEVSHQLLQGL